MPFSNIITTHLTDEQNDDANDALDVLEVISTAISQNLSPEERQQYGSINEQNKLLANKVHDYHVNSPELQSPDVDWNEFERDYQTRQRTEALILRAESILKRLIDAKTLHDYDNNRLRIHKV